MVSYHTFISYISYFIIWSSYHTLCIYSRPSAERHDARTRSCLARGGAGYESYRTTEHNLENIRVQAGTWRGLIKLGTWHDRARGRSANPWCWFFKAKRTNSYLALADWIVAIDTSISTVYFTRTIWIEHFQTLSYGPQPDPSPFPLSKSYSYLLYI